jgi:3-phytase
VVTDRNRRLLRVFSVPDMTAIDGGGIPAFVGEAERRPMGIGLYKRPSDGEIFAIVSRKGGPSGAYLWQYRLRDRGDGTVAMDKVRAFGKFTGGHEIEAIVVDDELGYIYYADETAGIRKYPADPDAAAANDELAFFARKGFTDDHEGLSIYQTGPGNGYLLASDQQANRFQIFRREGAMDDPHRHERIKIVTLSTHGSDGSEATAVPLGKDFPCGLFVAMSEDKTFQLYDWRDIAGDELESAGGEACR